MAVPDDPASRRWRALVPVVCLVAGLGFAVSARESNGHELRNPVNATVAGTVQQAEDRVHRLDRTVRQLQSEVNRLANQAGSGDSAVARARAEIRKLAAPTGLTAVHGPGLEVVLDDAPAQPSSGDVDPNQLVVH